MGGFGCWYLALAAPERFAAIVPDAGGGPAFISRSEMATMSPGLISRSEMVATLAKLPIWAFHGAKDEVVPPESTQAIIEAIQEAGGDARLTLYEDRGHNTCQATFSREDVYEWLLRQRRGGAP
jgi:predicted peptidase